MKLEPGYADRPLLPCRDWWTWGRFALLLGIFALCCATRLYDLGRKPIMHDESLFAYYTEFTLVRSWSYEYMPILHGPAMLWIQTGIFHLFGTNDYTLRLGAALLGIGGFVWIWTLRGWIGSVGTWWALTFYSVSPGLMFYQRFFRNDGLFFFVTLWIVASAAWWWKTRSSRWAASFLLANAVLFCNKESSVFIYFTLATFALLVLVRDHADGFFRQREAGYVRPRVRPPSPWAIAAVLFFVPVALLVLVFEGIQYEDSVVAAIGRDFVLRDVRSIPLALGWHEDVPGLGRVGESGFWRLAYIGLAVGSIAAGWLVHASIRGCWGRSSVLASAWQSLVRARWAVAGAAGLAVALYLILFTTFFKFPAGPFQLYHETLAYWMGQHAQHRIRGPFHMHMLIVLIYEFPLVLLMAGSWIALALRMRWEKGSGLGLVLAGVGFAAFHGAFLGGTGIGYFKLLAVGAVLLGALFSFVPTLGRAGSVCAFLLFLLYSLAVFHGTWWFEFMNTPLGDGVGMTGRDLLDDRIGLTSGMHLFLIALLILVAAHLAWDALGNGRGFEAFTLWWLITMTGAASYAREKVPWVGVHISIPLVILAGIYVQRLWNWCGTLRGRAAARTALVCVFALSAVWTFRAAHMANFRHPGDVRERLAYGETVIELKLHAERIVGYAEITSVRAGTDVDPFTGDWRSNYNRPAAQRHVRVAIDNETVVWPLRWYLRDIEHTDAVPTSSAMAQDYHFIFTTPALARETEGLADRYHLLRGRSRMHYLPRRVDFDGLLGLWRVTIPYHNRGQGGRDARLERARQEWRGVWRYFVHRELPHTTPSELPTPEYVLAVRKDLAGW